MKDHAMSQTNDTNRRIVLASRPKGAPTAANFRMETSPMPVLLPDQILLRTVYLSLDPYMRGRMNDGPSYAPPIAIGAVMGGGTVSRVIASNHADYQVGDWVGGMSGWQDYVASGAADLHRLGNSPNPSWALGVLGMPGLTAYVGLLDIGEPKPGDTVVVAGATGAVGAVVGQIAKLKGCRVVGIAGGKVKCQSAVADLGLDVCIDHHEADFGKQLGAACPKGIDVYFENVGGAVFDAVLPLLNVGARVPVCGLISHYNDVALAQAQGGPDRLPMLMGVLLKSRIKMQGFIVGDHAAARHAAFAKDMSTWLAEGAMKYREDIVDGLENAPTALIGLLEGKNFGKLVVRIGHD
jgi:NADPH-dependent curcumin reductase